MAETFFFYRPVHFSYFGYLRARPLGKSSIVEKHLCRRATTRLWLDTKDDISYVRPRCGCKFKSHALHLFHGDSARFFWHRRYQKATVELVVDRRSKLTGKLYIVSREQSLLTANYIAFLFMNKSLFMRCITRRYNAAIVLAFIVVLYLRHVSN